MRYQIQADDTLPKLAERFALSETAIRWVNPQLDQTDQLQPGEWLYLPLEDAWPPSTFPYVVRRGDTLKRLVYRFGINLPALLASNPQVTASCSLIPGEILLIPAGFNRRYVLQAGDTWERLALGFGVPVSQLRQANLHVTGEPLPAGEPILIPRASSGKIVIPRDDYGYDEMMEDLERLCEAYPFLEVVPIGRSVMGRSIPAVRIGKGPKEVHYNGSFHANEWITTVVLLAFLEEYAEAVSTGKCEGWDGVLELYETTTLWMVPMVNPDGVELVQEGVLPDHPFYDELLRINGQSHHFSGWKANIRGVDLNDQFPANWAKEAARRSPGGPAPRDYPGPAPLSEPETRALADFVRDHNFELVMAFHTQGEVIYWGYRGFEPASSAAMAARFARITDFRAVQYVESDAGFKDWFIYEFGRPGFTVELGNGMNPLPFEQFWSIWSRVRGLLYAGLQEAGSGVQP